MPIDNPNPTIIPATEAKSFPHLWLYNVICHAPSVSSGRILIETLPYNAETSEIGSGQNMVAISTDKLWEAGSQVPEVASAMEAILNAVNPLRDWITQQQEIQETQQSVIESV